MWSDFLRVFRIRRTWVRDQINDHETSWNLYLLIRNWKCLLKILLKIMISCYPTPQWLEARCTVSYYYQFLDIVDLFPPVVQFVIRPQYNNESRARRKKWLKREKWKISCVKINEKQRFQGSAILRYRLRWQSGNTRASHSGGARFISRNGHSEFVRFLILRRQIPEWYHEGPPHQVRYYRGLYSPNPSPSKISSKKRFMV